MKSPMMALEHETKNFRNLGRETLKCQGAGLRKIASVCSALSLVGLPMMTYSAQAFRGLHSHVIFSLPLLNASLSKA